MQSRQNTTGLEHDLLSPVDVLNEQPPVLSPMYIEAKNQWECWLVEQVNQGKIKPFTTTVVLNPILAQLIMDNNPHNRPISKKLKNFIRDVRKGQWQHNGVPIIIADSGELNDGQHRCAAVIRTGISIVTEIHFGAPRDSRRTVDIGIKRTVGQFVTMAGHSDGGRIAHAARVIIMFDQYHQISRSSDLHPTSFETQLWVEEHSELQDHLKWGRLVHKECRCSIGLFTALHFLFSRNSDEDADAFFSSLASGEMLKQNEPIFQLRKFLLKESVSKKKSFEIDIAAYTIKAWNYHRRGRTVKLLEWRKSSNPDERFPIPE